MHDVAIVGAGPVGGALALALADADLDVVALDARTAGSVPRGDRSLALSHGARLIFERLGVWSRLAAVADAVTPIVAIDISQAGGFGVTRARRRPSRACPRSATSCRTARCSTRSTPRWTQRGRAACASARAWRVSAARRDARTCTLAGSAEPPLLARLAVVADGSGTTVHGVAREHRDYGQVALIAKVRMAAPHAGVAYERFTAERSDGAAAGGRSLRSRVDDDAGGGGRALATARRARSSASSRITLAHACATSSACASAGSFPLALEFAPAESSPQRCVLIGNAAQALHPIAGQGFNLGIARRVRARAGDQRGDARRARRPRDARARTRRAARRPLRPASRSRTGSRAVFAFDGRSSLGRAGSRSRCSTRCRPPSGRSRARCCSVVLNARSLRANARVIFALRAADMRRAQSRYNSIVPFRVCLPRVSRVLSPPSKFSEHAHRTLHVAEQPRRRADGGRHRPAVPAAVQAPGRRLRGVGNGGVQSAAVRHRQVAPAHRSRRRGRADRRADRRRRSADDGRGRALQRRRAARRSSTSTWVARRRRCATPPPARRCSPTSRSSRASSTRSCAAVDVPVTLKIRTGPQPGRAQCGGDRAHRRGRRRRGADRARPHARVRVRRRGRVRHDRRGQARGRAFPVIANGDIDTPERAQAVLAHTGADAVMIGRAAQGRPWIFREIAHFLATGEHLPPPTVAEVRDADPRAPRTITTRSTARHGRAHRAQASRLVHGAPRRRRRDSAARCARPQTTAAQLAVCRRVLRRARRAVRPPRLRRARCATTTAHDNNDRNRNGQGRPSRRDHENTNSTAATRSAAASTARSTSISSGSTARRPPASTTW